MTSRAVVATAPGEVEFREVASPDPGPGDVVVRLRWSWISNGTEGSFVRGERIAGDTPRRATDPLPFPHVPGYQSVGQVISGEGYAPGDWVFGSIAKLPNRPTAQPPFFFPFGGHLSPAVFDASQVWPLPPGLDPLAASGAVLTQVGWNAGTRPPVAPGERAIVVGDGLVGHWSAQTLLSRGARVLMLGRHRDRTDRFPGPSALSPEEALAWAGGEAAAIVHTAGTVRAVEALYPALRRGGWIVSAAFVGEDGATDVQLLRDRELTLASVSGWTRDRVSATLAALADGSLDSLSLVTHRFPAPCAAEAYDLILNRREPCLGVVLDWENV